MFPSFPGNQEESASAQTTGGAARDVRKVAATVSESSQILGRSIRDFLEGIKAE